MGFEVQHEDVEIYGMEMVMTADAESKLREYLHLVNTEDAVQRWFACSSVFFVEQSDRWM